jgi:hypothetical protein
MASVITSISGLQNLPNLINFNADWNGFASIDFSGLANLTEIDISDCNLPDGSSNSLTSIDLTGCSALLELRADDSDFSQLGMASIIGLAGLVNLQLLDLDQCGISGAVDLSMLPALNSIDLNGNTGVTSINILNSQPIYNLNAQDCALTQANVDNLLVALSLNTVNNGSVYLAGGTNAVPTATGLSAKTTLESNGWYVTVNVLSQNPE